MTIQNRRHPYGPRSKIVAMRTAKSGFPLRTENMNGELFVNELIICFVDLSTELKIGESYSPFAPAHQ